MRRTLAAVVVAGSLAVPLSGVAAADPGGLPDDNAQFVTGNGDPEGRKGNCIVPGLSIRNGFKTPGPVFAATCTDNANP